MDNTDKKAKELKPSVVQIEFSEELQKFNITFDLLPAPSEWVRVGLAPITIAERWVRKAKEDFDGFHISTQSVINHFISHIHEFYSTHDYAEMPTYNFSAITTKYDIIAEYKNYPVLPQKGDLMLIDGHPMKIVRWVHDYKEGTSGFAVMVVRDLDLEPYTRQEVRQRIEAGETFWIRTGCGMKLRRYKGDEHKHPEWLDFDPVVGRQQAWGAEEDRIDSYVQCFLNGMYTFSVDDANHLKNSNK